jgi:hypothetical protein
MGKAVREGYEALLISLPQHNYWSYCEDLYRQPPGFSLSPEID